MLTFAIKMQHGMVHNWKKKKMKITNLKEFGKFMNHSKNYNNHEKKRGVGFEILDWWAGRASPRR